jgi:hypothetical protein
MVLAQEPLPMMRYYTRKGRDDLYETAHRQMKFGQSRIRVRTNTLKIGTAPKKTAWQGLATAARCPSLNRRKPLPKAAVSLHLAAWSNAARTKQDFAMLSVTEFVDEVTRRFSLGALGDKSETSCASRIEALQRKKEQIKENPNTQIPRAIRQLALADKII